MHSEMTNAALGNAKKNRTPRLEQERITQNQILFKLQFYKALRQKKSFWKSLKLKSWADGAPLSQTLEHFLAQTLNYWHLHPAWAQYRTSESSGDRISFGLITDHKDNGFLLTKISGKPFCCWASNLCLDLDFLLYLKWMHACWS